MMNPCRFFSTYNQPKNHSMWINKSEPPEWFYAEQPDLVNVELASSLDKLKPGEKAAFMILDVRELHEQELMDFPKYTKV